MELSELIESVNIVEYISQYVDLEVKGQEYWGISPFTFPPEKTPSFSVRPNPPCFYDYSSGIGGNVFTFVRYHDKCSAAEAVDTLNKYLGCSTGGGHKRLETTSVFKKYMKPKVTEKTAKSKPLGQDFMDRYEQNPAKLELWRKEGITDDAMEKFFVRYDPFSNCIVYPIRDVAGNIVNVGNRTLDEQFKEHGKHKYGYFFQWGKVETLYGLAENLYDIKKKHEVIIFEGCKSVLKAWSWDVKNCAAALTSHLNQAQMKILAQLGCDVVFAFDNDVDILHDRNIAKLKQYVNVFYIKDTKGMLDTKDSPCDKGEIVFKDLYDRRLRVR